MTAADEVRAYTTGVLRARAAYRRDRDREGGWCVTCHTRRRDKNQPRCHTCRKEKK